ncbi:YqzE family protein [Paenibacillus rhizoplanae]
MASGGDDLVKYITEKVVVYIENPRAVHARRKAEKQPWAEKNGSVRSRSPGRSGVANGAGTGMVRSSDSAGSGIQVYKCT